MVTEQLTQEFLAPILAYVDRWIGGRRAALDIPGMAVAVALHGEVIFDEVYGDELTPDHLFRIASHSKSFTATAIMQLFERGKLSLDDPLGSFIPDLDNHEELARLSGVTVRELLSHGSGTLRDGVDADFWQLFRAFPEQDQLLELMRAQSRVFSRNDRFHYSNIGYGLLGMVIEHASGTSFSEYVKKSILAPLHAEHIAVDYDAAHAGDYAIGFTAPINGKRLPIEQITTGSLASATGFASNASDLVRFFSTQRFNDETLLTDASKSLMQQKLWTQHKHEHYGLGLRLLDVGEWTFVGHSGGFPGFSTITWCEPRVGIAVSVLTNTIDANPTTLCSAICKLIERACRDHQEVGGWDHDPALPKFAGRFSNIWQNMDIVPVGRRIYLLDGDVDDPSETVGQLERVDDNTLILAKAHDGYVSEGENFVFEFNGKSDPVRVSGYGGLTFLASDRYQQYVGARDRIRLGDAPE